LAAELAADPDGWGALVEGLRQARPTLLTPRPLADCCDRDLASAADVVLAPFPLASLRARGLVAVSPGSWRETAALFLGARLRGDGLAERRQRALDGIRLEARRARQLEAHLVRDLGGLGSEDELRRQGEALLAFGGRVAPGSDSVVVPDPYDPGLSLRLGLDAKLSLHANADRLFDRGRRVVRARRQIESRLAATRVAAEALTARERALNEATSLDQLEAPRAGTGGGSGGSATGPASGVRSYLTSRGLSLLVGRAARENHRLTFAVAKPEDLWFHALGVPGAHVILRDNEGRAGPEDLREAAEVAAFFSEARSAGKVDVQAARRKHLRAAKGSPGRVYVSHSDTLRVTPRDPEGRLRKR
jgi:predicted ribosome quality control (RQC) complex YloA/Tae2 family protein